MATETNLINEANPDRFASYLINLELLKESFELDNEPEEQAAGNQIAKTIASSVSGLGA
jgi:hypothetical protein